MALSGSISNAFRTGYRIQIDWTATQNVANNTSTITAKFYLISTGSGYNIISSASKTCITKIDGVNYSNSVTIGLSGNQTKLLATNTRTISHNADGTKTFKLGGSLELAVTLSGTYWGTVNIAEQTFTLDTIPRATQPTLSAGTTTMGNAVTINTPRASGSFTHTLRYAFGNTSGTIATGVATSYAWTIPLLLANQIPSATSGKGTIYCDTYNGSTLIGSKTVQFTATVPSSVKPTVSISKSGVSLYSGYYVQGKSKVSVTLSVDLTGAYGATIKSRSTTVKSGSNLISSSTSNSFTSGILNYSGTITIATTVTDSRWRTASASTTISVVAYSAPQVTAFKAFRANSDGSANPQGAYIRMTGSGSISPINGTNVMETRLRYRVRGTTTWTNAATNTTSYTPSLASTISADVNSSFEVQLYVADYFTNSSQVVNVGTAFVLMDFYEGGTGMAIGKVSEEGDIFEIALPTRFIGPVTKNEPGNDLLAIDTSMVRFRSDGSTIRVTKGGTIPPDLASAISGHYIGFQEDGIWYKLRSGYADNGVVDFGTNANGSYVKFGDGLMLCWVTEKSSAVETKTWTFPASFRDNQASVLGQVATPQEYTDLAIYLGGRTQTGMGFRVSTISGGLSSQTVMLFAIGWWK